MELSRVDHVVIPVSDLKEAKEFYGDTMGLEIVEGAGKYFLAKFNDGLLKIKAPDNDDKPKAHNIAFGAVDVCLLTDDSIDNIVGYMGEKGVLLLEGPVERMGAKGPVQSVYFRDPDDNLIEIASYNHIEIMSQDKQPDRKRIHATAATDPEEEII